MIIFLLNCLAFTGRPQTISGRVTDTQNKPLEFANVLLLNASDSVLVKGAITNEKGCYVFENITTGKYCISSGMIGYKTALSAPFAFSQNTPNEMQVIKLAEDEIMLDEVVVQSQKPLYERQVDRTIVNVQSNVINQASSVTDVLGRSPGVIVNKQNNSIQMEGKSGVRVMINGRMSRIPMEALVQMLDGMSAANVKKIELITAPPSRYEAEGNAGIINIVILENPDLGTNGSAGVRAGYNTGIILGADGNLSHRGKKVSSFLNFSVKYDDKIEEWDFHHKQMMDDFLQTTDSENDRSPVIIYYGFQGGLEYDLTGTTTLSTQLGGSVRDWDTHDNTHVVSFREQGSRRVTDMATHETNMLKNVNGNFGIMQRLNDQLELELLYDFLWYHQDQPTQYYNQEFINNNPEAENTSIDACKNTPMNFHVFSLNHYGALGSKINLETGAKATFSSFTNEVEVREAQNGSTLVTNPEFTSTVTMDEAQQQGYVSVQWFPDSTWSLKAGLRYEHTTTEMHTPYGQTVLDRDFGNWAPSFFVMRPLPGSNSLAFSYNRRITRPRFSDLAPFVYFISPTSFIQGNEALRPAISDNIKLGYQHKNVWFSLTYSYTANEIVPWQLQENATNEYQLSQAENLSYMQFYSVSLSFPVYIGNWWEMQNYAEAYRYKYLSQHLGNNAPHLGNKLVLNSDQTFTLPADFTISMSFWYIWGDVSGTNQTEPFGQADLGISKKFRNSSTLTLTLVDPFALNVWEFNGHTNYNETNVIYNLHVRSINLRYSIPFGNRKLKNVRIKSGANEERKRVD